MDKTARSRRPKRTLKRAKEAYTPAPPDLYAQVLVVALEHPVIDTEGCVGFEVDALLGHQPVSKVGVPCELGSKSVLTLKDLVALATRLRRLTKQGRRF